MVDADAKVSNVSRDESRRIEKQRAGCFKKKGDRTGGTSYCVILCGIKCGSGAVESSSAARSIRTIIVGIANQSLPITIKKKEEKRSYNSERCSYGSGTRGASGWANDYKEEWGSDSTRKYECISRCSERDESKEVWMNSPNAREQWGIKEKRKKHDI